MWVWFETRFPKTDVNPTGVSSSSAQPLLAAYPAAPPKAPKAVALPSAARAGARSAKRGMTPPCCCRRRRLPWRPLGQCRRRRLVGILVWLAPLRPRSLL